MSGVQLQGVLDEFCFYEGPLGATLAQDSVHINVWAPTAQQVRGVSHNVFAASTAAPLHFSTPCQLEDTGFLMGSPLVHRVWEGVIVCKKKRRYSCCFGMAPEEVKQRHCQWYRADLAHGWPR